MSCKLLNQEIGQINEALSGFRQSKHPVTDSLGRKILSIWSGDHGVIKDALNLGGTGKVFISPDGKVWTQNPDGSYEDQGDVSSYTGSGKPSGQRDKDRGGRGCRS